MIFLGTGAAEMYPNPFCDCKTCERARREGAIPRKRSALLLDAENLMDFGPDVPAASQMYNASLAALKNVFITHTHEDHFSAPTFEILTMTPRRWGKPINVYLSPEAYAWTKQAQENDIGGFRCLNSLLDHQAINFVVVEPYTQFTAGDVWGFTVQSNHRGCGENEFALNYRLDLPNGKRILYVTDSGLYSVDNLTALRGSHCDILVMEGTNGSRPAEDSATHLNAVHFCDNVRNMLDCGVIDRDTQVYVTHINQVNDFSHEEYQEYLDKNCVIPAVVGYDGMEI